MSKKGLRANTSNKNKRRKTAQSQQNDQVTEDNFLKENPFINWIVVNTILKFLPEEDLRACRLINKVWSREADGYLKHRCKYINLNRAPQLQKIPKLLKLIEASKNFPFTKIAIPSFVRMARSLQLVLDLLACMAPTLVGLNLGVEMWDENPLKNLHFPKLTELQFTEYPTSTVYKANSMILKILETHSQQLKSLQIFGITAITLEEIASNPVLQLTTLTLYNYQHENLLVQQIVNKQKETLINLDLIPAYNSSNQASFWPVLCPNLKSLKIQNIGIFGKYDSEDGKENPFPALTSLTVSCGEVGRLTSKALLNLLGCQTASEVEDLELPCLLALNVFSILPHLFPNVIRLLIKGLHPNENLFWLLKPMLRLTTLKVYLPYLEEPYHAYLLERMTGNLTGLQVRECSEWQGWSEEKFLKMEQKTRDTFKEQKRNILKNITHVQLIYPELRVNMMNGLELPCRLVFLQMPNLTELVIRRYAERKRLVLSERMQFVQQRMQQKFVVRWETI